MKNAHLLICLAFMGCASPAVENEHSSRAAMHATPPRVDHHQHLLSENLADLISPPPLAPIELPSDLQAVLRSRTQHWDDATALSQLFTTDCILLSTRSPGWLRGNLAAAKYLSVLFSRDYAMRPVTYRVKDGRGHIAGYYTRGEADAATYLGSFYLALEKQANGQWLIAAETPTFPAPEKLLQPKNAAALITELDEAGIQRALVLSDAFLFDSRILPADDPRIREDVYARVRAENDWAAAQVERYPERLWAFCSFNVLAAYASAELQRCASDGRFRGIKLHFTEAGVDLGNPRHVDSVRKIFAQANAAAMPIIVHVGTQTSNAGEHARSFVENVLPAAPDVPIQLAHLWGGEQFSADALKVFADAMRSATPATRRLYFDIAETPLMAEFAGDQREAVLQAIATRIREIGVERVLFGSDDHLRAKQAWDAFRTSVPLTKKEFTTIANNEFPAISNERSLRAPTNE